MSATGTQLSPEPQFTYFHPTIQEYWRSVETAVVSKNLPAAQQAFAQLTKALQFPAQGQPSELANRISQGLQNVGKALEAGDLAGAARAISELPRKAPSIPEGQAQQQGVAGGSASSDDAVVSPGDEATRT